MVAASQAQLTRNGVDLSAVKLPKLQVLDPFDVEPLKDQIRKNFYGINELAASIVAAGQATPIIVRELPPGGEFPYGLIDGERRLRSCCQIKRGIISCIHDGVMELEDVHALSVAANFGRQKHDCIEIARAIRRFRKNGRKWKEICDIFGKSAGWVHQHSKLLHLHVKIQNWLVPGAVPSKSGNGIGKTKTENSGISLGSRHVRSQINFAIALQLLNLPKEHQLEAAKYIVEKNLTLAGARRFILQEARKLKGFVSTMLPNEWRSTVFTLANRIITTVGTYNDMPGEEFKRIFGGVSRKDLQKLYEALGKAGNEVEQLARGIQRAVDQRIQKIQKR